MASTPDTSDGTSEGRTDPKATGATLIISPGNASAPVIVADPVPDARFTPTRVGKPTGQ